MYRETTKTRTTLINIIYLNIYRLTTVRENRPEVTRESTGSDATDDDVERDSDKRPYIFVLLRNSDIKGEDEEPDKSSNWRHV